MLNKFRYSTSSVAAVIITLLCFLFMSLLIATPQHHHSQSIEMVSFSHVKDMKAPKVIEDKNKITKPVKEVIKQPPMAPKINITSNNSRPEITIPTGSAKITPENLSYTIPSNTFGPGNELHYGGEQALIPLYIANPTYPPKAAINKTEGWVKVEFTVNETGRVIKAKVVDAKPHNIFNTAALKAIYKSKFQPHIVDNIAVSQNAIQTFNFTLEN